MAARAAVCCRLGLTKVEPGLVQPPALPMKGNTVTAQVQAGIVAVHCTV